MLIILKEQEHPDGRFRKPFDDSEKTELRVYRARYVGTRYGRWDPTLARSFTPWPHAKKINVGGSFFRAEASQFFFKPLPSNIPTGLTQLNHVIFAYMVNNYMVTPSTESDWNHNAFSIENYRGRIVDAMLSVHPFLTDPSPTSAFPPRSLSNMTLREIFEDFWWNGLKETAEYLALDQAVKDRIELVTEEINRTYSRTLWEYYRLL